MDYNLNDDFTTVDNKHSNSKPKIKKILRSSKSWSRQMKVTKGASLRGMVRTAHPTDYNLGESQFRQY